MNFLAAATTITTTTTTTTTNNNNNDKSLGDSRVGPHVVLALDVPLEPTRGVAVELGPASVTTPGTP